MLKRLAKQRKHYLSLARESFKNQENIKRKREAGNILQKREVFGRKRRVITFRKLYQQHLERLSLRGRVTKRHRHLTIKAFAFFKLYPKLIDVLIWITLKRTPQIPVNTCVAAILDQNESPTNAPHSSGQKQQNTRIPHMLGAQRAANREIKLHWSLTYPRVGMWGGGGFRVYLDWCITKTESPRKVKQL